MSDPTFSPKLLTFREEWLQEAVSKLTPYLSGHGLRVPAVRVSCGWPSRNATGSAKRTIGECWDGKCAADGVPQLFISPLLDKVTDPMGVLATLTHEILHAVDFEAKHGARFKKMATRVGLEGKPTSTHAGDTLVGLFERILGELGAYPHVALTITKERKKQTTRQKKCECATCGYVARVAQKWMDVGLPFCPGIGHGQMVTPLEFNEPPEGE